MAPVAQPAPPLPAVKIVGAEFMHKKPSFTGDISGAVATQQQQLSQQVSRPHFDAIAQAGGVSTAPVTPLQHGMLSKINPSAASALPTRPPVLPDDEELSGMAAGWHQKMQQSGAHQSTMNQAFSRASQMQGGQQPFDAAGSRQAALDNAAATHIEGMPPPDRACTTGPGNGGP